MKTLLGRVCGIFCMLWAARSLYRHLGEARALPWIVDGIVPAIGVWLLWGTGGMMGRVRRHRQPSRSL